MIVAVYSLMGKIMGNAANDVKEHVPSVYIQNAPEDIEAAMKTADFQADLFFLTAKDNIDDIKNEIHDGKVDLLVVFDEGFRDTVSAYKQTGDPIPEVKTFYNSAEDYSALARDNFVNNVLVNTYKQNILAERLGNADQLNPFVIDKDPDASDIVDEKKAEGKLLSMMLPFLINIMLFAGAMGLGVDAITGEKERGTLSSMLLAPINRGKIVLGKLTSLAILSSISAAISLVAIVVALPNLMGGASGGEVNNMKLNFSPVEIMQLLILMLVLVYLYVSLVSLVAVMAKTSKEANTYVMPIYILVMIGGIMTYADTGEGNLRLFCIPFYNTAVSIQNILMGEYTMAQFGVTVGITGLLAIIVTSLITKAFNNEKVMFNA
jgi:sodium transport system permease protein